MNAPAIGIEELSGAAEIVAGDAKSAVDRRTTAAAIAALATPLAAPGFRRRKDRGNLIARRGGLWEAEAEAEGPVEDAARFGEAKGVAGSPEHDRRDVDAGGSLYVGHEAVAGLVDETGLAARDVPLAAEQTVGIDQVVDPSIRGERVLGLLGDRAHHVALGRGAENNRHTLRRRNVLLAQARRLDKVGLGDAERVDQEVHPPHELVDRHAAGADERLGRRVVGGHQGGGERAARLEVAAEASWGRPRRSPAAGVD